MKGSNDHLSVHPAHVVLARRSSAGIQVTLLRATDTDALAVRVRDRRTDDQFETRRRARRQRAGRLRAPLRLRCLARRRLPAEDTARAA